MALETQTFCNGLMASMDERPTISEVMHKAIAECTFPGGAVAFGSCTVPCYYQAYGTYTFESTIAVTPESMWDTASLTKIMATVSSIMILYERGKIALEEVVCKYIPEFGTNGKEFITVRQLLTHTAGLREFYPFLDMGLTKRDQVVDYIMADKVWYTTGMARYSDLSMIVLGLIVERIAHVPLEVFAAKEIFEPFAQTMLAGGMDQASSRRLFKESTMRLFTTPGLKTLNNPRPFALGWDVAVRRSIDGYTSAGKFMGPRTFGHTGFTGTSLWIDPDRNLFVALLTNAVHPTAEGGFGARVREVRPQIADAAAHAMGEQAIPREPLTWHLRTALRLEEKTFLALQHEHRVLFSADDDTLAWAGSPEHSTTTSSTREEAQPSLSVEPPASTLTATQVTTVTFASMSSSVVLSQNLLSPSSAEKQVLWRKLVVPIVCIALVMGVIA